MGTRKQGEETKRKIMQVVLEQQPVSTAVIVRHTGMSDVTVRGVCRLLERSGHLKRDEAAELEGRTHLWSVANPDLQEDTTPRRPSKPEPPDHWTPQPWIHPIRRRFLTGR